MKRLLLITILLSFYSFIVAQAQSQTSSRKMPKSSLHTKRAGFAKPPYPWLNKMEGDSLEMARQKEWPRNLLPPHLAGERQRLLQNEAEDALTGEGGLEPNDPFDRLYPPHKRPLAQMPTHLKIGSAQILSGDVQEAWVARYDAPTGSEDTADAIAVDAAGNVYVTGKSGIYPNSNYVTIKYNPTGTQMWLKTNAGTPFALAVDGAGNVYVTGSNGTVKYNSAGQQQWIAYYNGSGSFHFAIDLAVDGAGNVYVTGYYSDHAKYVTIKYNSNGTQEWVAIYEKPGISSDNLPVALAVDGTGNIYVTGASGKNIYAAYDYTTVKYSSAGTQEWVATYNGSGNWEDIPVALAVDGAGNVYVTGYSSGSGTNYDYATIKYNSTGTPEWVATYGAPQNRRDYASALAVDGAGNVYVTGYSNTDTSRTAYDYTTIKYDAAGTKNWIRTYSGPGNNDDVPTALAVDGAGNVYVTGGSGGDYATVKYNSAGLQQWVIRYDGPGNSYDGANDLAVDGGGNVYVAGSSYNSNSGFDLATIKYTQNSPPSADAGPDKTICANGSVQIGGSPTGSGGNGGPYTFSWTPTTGLNDPTVPNPIASPTATTTYIVTVTETATGLSATDDVTVTVPATGWSIAHIVDVDDMIFGIDQGTSPRNNRSLALSLDERFLYLGYTVRVRKIDLSVTDPAQNHSAVVAQLNLPAGTRPPMDIATDDKGRVYLALGTRIEVHNANLQTPPLHTISGFTACEGVTVRRENGALVVYATDRLDKTLERFVLVEGIGDAIVSSSKTGLDGDGEVRIIGAFSPRGLDVASNGTAWIADRAKGKVYRVNAAGSTVDSTGVKGAMDIAIDESRGEVYISQDTLRTIKVLNFSTMNAKRTLTPPAAGMNIDLDGEAGLGALTGIDVASCQRVFVANSKGRSILTGNPSDSPFSNVGDNNDIKAADTDPVLVVIGKGLAKESAIEEPEVASHQLSVTSYQLEQNYPNPFWSGATSPALSGGNPSTKISFALPEAAEVSLKIYDMAGQLVHTLVDGVVQAGRHQVVWDGTNQRGKQVASGIYFYQLRAGEFKQVRKMSLVR